MSSVHILVVEDERATLKVVGHVLERLGYKTELLESAEQGLEAFAKRPFEVVLSDVELPGIDGVEMVRRLHAVDPALVSIIMTTRHDQDIAVRALEYGVSSFLHKPFTTEQLQAKIERALCKRRQQVEARLMVGEVLHKRSMLQEAMQKQTRKLARTESYLHHLINAAPFGIVSTDMTGEIQTINKRAEEMYGCTADEVVGRDVSVLFDVGRMATSSRATHRRQDGESFPVLLYRQEILDDGRQRIAWLYMVEDLSEREKLEEQLLYAERLSTLGHMAPRIAHEFKTPLQMIMGYTELAIDALRSDDIEQGREFLQVVPPAAQQLLELIQQMMRLGKPVENRREELDLSEELTKILDTLNSLGTLKYCRVVRDFSAPLPKIQGDPAQIEQVFRNLIVNAVQAMENAAEQTITVRLQPSADGARVEAVLSDTGPGIPAEYRDRIFESFFTTKPEGKGTGLGLSIVKTILDHHEATIQVEDVSRGTRFLLSFPALRPGEEHGALQRP